MITYKDMLRCAERELIRRRTFYRYAVTSCQMTKETAKHEIACMVEIVAVLKEIEQSIRSSNKPLESL